MVAPGQLALEVRDGGVVVGQLLLEGAGLLVGRQRLRRLARLLQQNADGVAGPGQIGLTDAADPISRQPALKCCAVSVTAYGAAAEQKVLNHRVLTTSE